MLWFYPYRTLPVLEAGLPQKEIWLFYKTHVKSFITVKLKGRNMVLLVCSEIASSFKLFAQSVLLNNQ